MVVARFVVVVLFLIVRGGFVLRFLVFLCFLIFVVVRAATAGIGFLVVVPGILITVLVTLALFVTAAGAERARASLKVRGR